MGQKGAADRQLAGHNSECDVMVVNGHHRNQVQHDISIHDVTMMLIVL
jgi:hypothetical protein